MSRELYGRKEIFTNEESITSANVVQVLKDTFSIHQQNSGDIQYLYDVYRGKQDIRFKKKEVRPDINHRICENRANEVTSFYLGYVFCDAIQYIRRGSNEASKKALETLNGYLNDLDKPSLDRALAEWMFVCGVGYRLVLPVKDNHNTDEFFHLSSEPPFVIYTLDPRYAYVVKHNNLAQNYAMGVKYIEQVDGDQTKKVFSVYTKDTYFEIKDDKIVKEEQHTIGTVPFVEYPLNRAGLGIFEVAIPLLDAINEVQSNRLDDIVQYVNSFLALLGGEMNDEVYKQLESYKMLCLPEGTDAKYLSASMNQGDIGSLADTLYQNVLTICGVPNRNGGSSTSDTGQAVYLRDGWSGAETRAKDIESMFKKSERRLIAILSKYMETLGDAELPTRDVEVKFPMRYKENLLTITQSMLNLLEMGVHPEVVFSTGSIWSDSKGVYELSKPFLTKWDVDLPDEEDFDANERVDKTEKSTKEGVNV